MQLYRRRDASLKFLQGYVRVAGDEHDLDVGIELANLAPRLHAVNARRHADVEDDHVEGLTFTGGISRDRNGIVALRAGNDVELRFLLRFRAGLEQLGRQRVERAHLLRRLGFRECLTIGLQHVFVVVGDQYSDVVLLAVSVHGSPPCAAGSST